MKVHNKLEEWFGNLDYSDVRGTVEPVFGKDWKYDIDKVGSKWVIVEDCYFDEDSSYINFVTGMESSGWVLRGVNEGCIRYR